MASPIVVTDVFDTSVDVNPILQDSFSTGKRVPSLELEKNQTDILANLELQNDPDIGESNKIARLMPLSYDPYILKGLKCGHVKTLVYIRIMRLWGFKEEYQVYC